MRSSFGTTDRFENELIVAEDEDGDIAIAVHPEEDDEARAAIFLTLAEFEAFVNQLNIFKAHFLPQLVEDAKKA